MTEMVKILEEDKVVKFNGKTYPDSGWCVILAGGPGSGKSTMRKHLVPFDAKIYDPDEISTFLNDVFTSSDKKYQKFNKKFHSDKLNKDIDPRNEFSDEEIDMGNGDYVDWLRTMRKETGLADKKFDAMFSNASNGDTLPNLLFDTTGDNIGKLNIILLKAKELGYKTSLIYVFNDIDTQIANNNARVRKLDVKLVREITNTVYSVLIDGIRNIGVKGSTFSLIDECWAIMSINFNLKTTQGKYDCWKEQNVFYLGGNGNIDLNIGNVQDFIETQIQKLKTEGFSKFYESYNAYTQW